MADRKTKKIDYEIISEALIQRVLSRIFIMFIMLGCTQFLTNSITSIYTYYLTSRSENLIKMKNSHANGNLDTYKSPAFVNVSRIDDIWNYCKYDFLYFIHQPDNSSETFALLFDEGLIVGLPRMRQLRVKDKKCSHVVDFDQINGKRCYPQYSISHEYTGTFAGSNYEKDANIVETDFVTYQGGGFSIQLQPSFWQNMQIMTNLSVNRWIDSATRLFVLEFSVYYSDPDIFQVIKLVFQIMPTGLVVPSLTIRSIPLTCFLNRNTETKIACVIFYVIVVFYSYCEIYEIFAGGLRKYVTNFYNYADFLFLITSYLTLCSNIWHILEIRKIEEEFHANPKTYIHMDDLLTFWLVYIEIVGFLHLAAWLKLVRLISFHRTIRQLATSMKMSLNNLAGFIFIYAIIVYAFAKCGNVGFADKLEAWISGSSCVVEIMRFILSNVGYLALVEANSIMAPIIFVGVILTITMIFLNLFTAIFLNFDSYVKKYVEVNDHLVAKMLWRGLKNYICVWRKWDKTKIPLVTTLQPVDEDSDADEESHKQEVPVFHAGTIRNLREQLADMSERLTLIESMLESFVSALENVAQLLENQRRKEGL